MDNPEPEFKALIGIATNLLKTGEFTGCRKIALLARRRDPSNPTPDRILAVADVLLADKRRDPNDFHPILDLIRADPVHDLRHLRTRFESLSSLLDPDHNSFPFADVALCLVNKAWEALSDPGKMTRTGNEAGQGTFWTVCPYCYGLFLYEKIYEECCLRCQVCRKAFHGKKIRPPAPEMMVAGKEEYYFTYGCFRIEYGDDEESKKKSDEGVCVVEISDDDEEEEKEEVKNVGEEVAAGKRKKARARTVTKGMKMKSVVRSSKKRMGNVVKEIDDLGGDVGDVEMDGWGGLEFYESGDDVLVGIGTNY